MDGFDKAFYSTIVERVTPTINFSKVVRKGVFKQNQITTYHLDSNEKYVDYNCIFQRILSRIL